MKLRIALVISLIILTYIPITFSQEQPAPIVGYVWLGNQPAPVGLRVNVTNTNTGETWTTYTFEHDNYTMYQVTINASDGDLIHVVLDDGKYHAENNTTVDLSLLTQWCNLTITGMTPPSADFDYFPANPKVGDNIVFTDRSYDPDGEIVEWYWNFGDGTASNKQNPTHEYDEPGTYIVTLKVKDNDGLYGSISKTITVESEEEHEDWEIFIPPPKPPIQPEKPYTIPQMYMMCKLPNETANGKIKIAVIDTGYAPREYNGINMSDICGYKVGNYGIFDDYGHGTWCNYAIHYVVDTRMPNAVHISIKALNETGVGTINDIKQAFELCKKLGVDVISISAGALGELGDELDKEVRKLADEGIVVVCAGGNSGPARYTILSPALSPDAIAVGAVNPMKTINTTLDDTVTPWSSRGPVEGLSEYKPDLVAGGESIIGPWLNGERIASGTSMATPIVAGGTAYIIAKNKFWWDLAKKLYFFKKDIVVHTVEKSLEKTAQKTAEPDVYAVGYGVPDFTRAEGMLKTELIRLCVIMIIVYLIIILTIIYVLWRKWKK